MYVDLIRPLFPDKPYYTSAMKKEIDRVNYAVETALGGSRISLVCSGDPGIYALAGLVFEICRSKSVRLPGPGAEFGGNKEVDLNLEIVPGIPALSSCASLAGAPLTHDFAAISLSDLLTPWEVIERRIEAAAFADFVIVLYNPKSKKRDWQLKKAVEIVLKHRDPKTPVGVVGRAMREGQRVTATTLEDIDIESVDMQSTVFIGNRTTFTFEGYMVTPRGYTDKYGLPRDTLSKETSRQS
jgi:precorrin-3B C17-methyltransferase